MVVSNTDQPPTAPPDLRSELAIAFVGPVGVRTKSFQAAAEERLSAFGYRTEAVRLSQLLREFADEGYLATVLEPQPEYERIRTHMDAGDELRSLHTGLLAHAAVGKVAAQRPTVEECGKLIRRPSPARVWLFNSLKHPDEVEVLRSVYRAGFFLIGLFATEAERRAALVVRGLTTEQAQQLIARDLAGEQRHGQQTRKTFELADAWVSSEGQLRRVLDLIFGDPFQTPSDDEYGMSLAYTAGLRSADLSRQVGASILTAQRDVIATGCNEVPAPGGGQYGPPTQERPSARDCEVGFDSNHRLRLKIQDGIARGLHDSLLAALIALGPDAVVDAGLLMRVISSTLDSSPLGDITEFGRAVHAEMSALLSAARAGVSVRGATLYSTTFPCHNCAKHIIAAGIARVVFVEPYPKSKAIPLHGDAITLVGEDTDASVSDLTARLSRFRTIFEPFLGVGPRRYVDLFSLKLGAGRPLTRKNGNTGEVLTFDVGSASPRVQMPSVSYLDREGESVDAVRSTQEAVRKGVK